MKDSNLGQNIKVGKLVGFSFLAERITRWGFGDILPSCVFIKDLQPREQLAWVLLVVGEEFT